jgi:hypothetical protein
VTLLVLCPASPHLGRYVLRVLSLVSIFVARSVSAGGVSAVLATEILLLSLVSLTALSSLHVLIFVLLCLIHH